MKLVREILYEKFTQEGDPVHDMGIGKIKIKDVYNEIMVPAQDKWNDFVNDLVGKEVTGRFGVLGYDATTGWFSGGFKGGGLSNTPTVLSPTISPEDGQKKTIRIKSIKRDPIFENPTDLTVVSDEDEDLIMFGEEGYIIKS